MDISLKEFRKQIKQGIPNSLPSKKLYDATKNHAPNRKNVLTKEEKILALKNALRYFPEKFHKTLAKEFVQELNSYGRIYMYRFKPNYKISARKLSDYPFISKSAGAIMLMISNNLDDAVAQHPDELIIYGGNGAAFQNWAQYLLTMQYLSKMTNEQTLVLYSGHPLGLFPSGVNSPRLVITNGMMVPNYSKPEDLEKFNALGVTQYGQMTAGSFMYIGPQGIVHGTTITILNAGRLNKMDNLHGKLFVSSGLGGMSGAQPKAAVIAGAIGVIAEINPKAIEKRFKQGWVDEIYSNLNELIERIKKAKQEKKPVSLGFLGNIVELWEKLIKENISVDLGSDQTSLHNPFAGGYYPAGLTFDQANKLMVKNPALFKKKVQESLKRQVRAINILCKRGMYFWDYGNAFLLEAKRAGADILKPNGSFKFPSYVEDIMGPMCFDFGFGPFRWVCTSSNPKDLDKTDKIAIKVLEKIKKSAGRDIVQQITDNIEWIKNANKNKLVVGSQARILYADAKGRIEIALAFNKAIREKKFSGLIVLGRDHHDVSGTDSPYRETANIYDGSQFSADMAVQNVIGDSFRGATWISLHNGGGVGWGEAINGGFGMVIDGSKQAGEKIKSMMYWDVYNGIARRSWARNKAAISTIEKELKKNKKLSITVPHLVDEKFLSSVSS